MPTPTPPTSDPAQLDALTPLSLAILEALALAGLLRAAPLADVLIRRKVLTLEGSKTQATAQLQAPIKALLSQGWLVVVSGDSYKVHAARRGSVLLRLLQGKTLASWIKVLEKVLAHEGYFDRTQARQLLWSALSGDLADAERLLPHYVDRRHVGDQLEYLFGWMPSPEGMQLLTTLSLDRQAVLLQEPLRLGNQALDESTTLYRYAVQRFADGAAERLTGVLAEQALLRGDIPTFQQLSSRLSQPPGLLSVLLHGNHDFVVSQLDALLKADPGSSKAPLPPMQLNYYVLALLGTPSASHWTLARRLLRDTLKQSYYRVPQVLLWLVEQLISGVALDTWQGEFSVALDGIDGVLLAIVAHWSDAPETRTPAWAAKLDEFRRRLRSRGYETLAQELDIILERQFALPRPDPGWHQQRHLRALVSLQRRQEAWELALSALAAWRPGKAAPNVDGQTRLVWVLERYYADRIRVYAREQKKSVKGSWSKGRQLPMRQLVDKSVNLAGLLPSDRKLVEALRREPSLRNFDNSVFAVAAETLLPYLIGHPLVTWDDAPDISVTIVEAHPALYLQADAAQIRVSLRPARFDEGDTACEEETPTRIKVYRLYPEARDIAAIVGSGLTLPASARAQLVAAIASIAPVLPVHSELPELAAHIETVAGDGKLYAHLLPYRDGLRLQLLVRPLADGGLADGGWYTPGEPPEHVLGDRQGQPIQARRQLLQEALALQAILERCPVLNNAAHDGRQRVVDDVQHCLQLLLELQAIPSSELECIWPEGERFRIKPPRSAQSLKLGIQQQGDWFVANGEIELDDGKLLQLRQLLELLRSTPGTFIKLNERDWLALSESLRRRLDELALLAEPSSVGIRLSRLAAPLLQELANDAGQCSGDAGWQAQVQTLAALKEYTPAVPSTLGTELRDYQREGYVWLSRLARWGVGACLADDMGLGKTIQALAVLLDRASGGPQLVVAPTSVVLNWCAEATKFAPTLRLRRYQEQRALDALAPFDVVLTSYGLLQLEAEAFAAVHWHSVVLDEAQAIKNSQTKRSQAAMALQAEFRLIASGTPVENHLGELWNLFRFINPALLGSQERFNQRFAAPIERGDRQARLALKRLLQPFILRRTKAQVLDELPARTEITLKIPLSNGEAHAYEALRQQALADLAESGPDTKPLQVLAAIMRLRRFCCHPQLVIPDTGLESSKLAAFAEIVSELLENRHKALVFSQFVDHLAIVRNWLEQQQIRYQYLDGSTPPLQRQQRVAAFQAGEGEVFLISLKAGGTGLNLTAADYVIHLDPWWNPAVEDQASDRAHRMGQTRPVTIYRLVAEHSIEEQIVALHAQKRDLADSLLEGGELSAKLSAAELLGLLRGE